MSILFWAIVLFFVLGGGRSFAFIARHGRKDAIPISEDENWFLRPVLGKEEALYQSLASCGAVLIAFIGVCHEFIGHIVFPWGPSTLGGPIGWHGLGIFSIVLGLLMPVPVRAVIWTVALLWMGTACILNAKRCGRIHCRYTGPYYLAMIVPVLVLGSGMVSVDWYGWLVLAVLIIGGSKFIWWATERAWGKFS